MHVRNQIRDTWYRFHATYWFLPLLMAVGAVIVAAATLAVDAQLSHGELQTRTWLVVNGAEAAALLTMLAGAMITVAGVVFSIMIVTLSLASSQFGPRLLRSFLQDTGTQVVLGTFTSTFLFCLIVLRVVNEAQSAAEVPQISVAAATILAIISLGVLIYFMNHVSVLIQAAHIIKVVGIDLDEAILRMFPAELGHESAGDSISRSQLLADKPSAEWKTIHAPTFGYVDQIDGDTLLSLAVQRDVLVWLTCRPGDLVHKGDTVMRVWPRHRVNEDLVGGLTNVVTILTRRTPLQDVECGINELVEVAVRALSPGINDPTTAVHCIDRLGASLALLASRDFPSTIRLDEKGEVRVITRPFTFRSAVNAAFDEIRQFGRKTTSVPIRQLDAIMRISKHVRRQADAQALLRQATMIWRGAKESQPEPNDRDDVRLRYLKTKRRLAKHLTPQREQPASSE